jgi:hypothetical protein
MRLIISLFALCLVDSVVQLFQQWYQNIFGTMIVKEPTTLPLLVAEMKL